MQLSEEEVRKIAYLARLELTDAEVGTFSQQLSGILSNADMLAEVDTSKVEPIAQITGLKNMSFKDEVAPCDRADDLLNQTPQQVDQHMIRIKNIL